MRVKKVGKIIAIITAIILLIEILYPVTYTYASFLGGVSGESRPSPPPSSGGGGGGGGGGSSTPTPTPTPTPNPTPDDDDGSDSSGPPAPTIIPVPCYTEIRGNVYEDLGYTNSGAAGGDDTTENIPVQDILVELYNAGDDDGDPVMTTRTDQNGYYSFRPSPGSYDVKFKCGYVENETDPDLLQRILKYNGQDYMVVGLPDKETINVDKIEVENAEKGVLQFFIALDCSSSMTDTENLIDYKGEPMTRLEIVVDAAKELCESLINSGDNIFIGLVFFKGETYRASSLTKNLDKLNKTLDSALSEETANWSIYDTNVYAAMDKVYESYYNNDPETSNRFVAILTDGTPTTDGSTVIYQGDSDETMYQKLDTVADRTAERLRALREDGVKVISLVTESTQEDESEKEIENSYVERVFDGESSDIFERLVDGYKTAELIEGPLKNYILAGTQDKDDGESSSEEYIKLAGYEDEERREEIDAQFEHMDYSNTHEFETIENFTTVEEAESLSDKTYMEVVGGQNYQIDELKEDEYHYAIWPETGEQYLATIVDYYEVFHEDQDMILAQRPGFALVTKITATGLRLILQNGQQIDTQKMEAGTEMPIIQTLDTELAQGTTLQLEYTITVKNDSSIQCNKLELLNYLPDKFSYDESTMLITADGTNADVGWEDVSLDELKEKNLITDETIEKYGDRQVLKLERNEPISPGGELELRYVVTRLIGGINDIENPDFTLASEILSYENTARRRLTYENDGTVMVAGVESHQLTGAYPGDVKNADYSDESTNYVIVLPPTGKEEEVTTLPKILSSSVLGLILEKIN